MGRGRPKKDVKVDSNLKKFIVPFCENRSLNGFFRIPEDRKEKWLELCEIKFEVTPDSRVCMKHFVESDFTEGSRNSKERKVLKKTALPSQNLPRHVQFLLTYEGNLGLGQVNEVLAETSDAVVHMDIDIPLPKETASTPSQSEIDFDQILTEHNYQYPNSKIELVYAQKKKLASINLSQRKEIRKLKRDLLIKDRQYSELSYA